MMPLLKSPSGPTVPGMVVPDDMPLPCPDGDAEHADTAIAASANTMAASVIVLMLPCPIMA
jgi:hypothetical protein